MVIKTSEDYNVYDNASNEVIKLTGMNFVTTKGYLYIMEEDEEEPEVLVARLYKELVVPDEIIPLMLFGDAVAAFFERAELLKDLDGKIPSNLSLPPIDVPLPFSKNQRHENIKVDLLQVDKGFHSLKNQA